MLKIYPSKTHSLKSLLTAIIFAVLAGAVPVALLKSGNFSFWQILACALFGLMSFALGTIAYCLVSRMIRNQFVYEITAKGIGTIDLFGKHTLTPWHKMDAISVQIAKDVSLRWGLMFYKKREHIYFRQFHEDKDWQQVRISICADDVTSSIQDVISHLLLIPEAACLVDETIKQYKHPELSFVNRNAGLINSVVGILVVFLALSAPPFLTKYRLSKKHSFEDALSKNPTTISIDCSRSLEAIVRCDLVDRNVTTGKVVRRLQLDDVNAFAYENNQYTTVFLVHSGGKTPIALLNLRKQSVGLDSENLEPLKSINTLKHFLERRAEGSVRVEFPRLWL